MSRVFITGSSDGLGLMAGRLLAADGHSVVLHTRNETRADDTRAALPEAAGVVVGDLAGRRLTQAWLAVSDDPGGQPAPAAYWSTMSDRGMHRRPGTPAWTTRSGSGYCAELSRTELPR